MDVNSVCIMGRLTKDPEAFSSNDENNRVEFSIANNKNKEQVNYFDCVLFGKTVDIFNVLKIKKGDQLIVNGSLSFSTYIKDNVKKQAASIIVSGFNLVQRKKVVKKEELVV